MKRSRFSKSQIVSSLKEADAGMAVNELCHKRGISDATYYNWKSRWGGMAASDFRRVKRLESELSRYKRMYAELARENSAMRIVIMQDKSQPGWTAATARGRHGTRHFLTIFD